MSCQTVQLRCKSLSSDIIIIICLKINTFAPYLVDSEKNEGDQKR